MTAPTDYLIAALATGGDPNNWTVVDTLLTITNGVNFDRVIEWQHEDASSYTKLANGRKRALGLPVVRWIFKGLRIQQREALRVYCTGISADVYIRTPTNETTGGVRIWKDYRCVMNWREGAEIIADSYETAEMVEMTFTNCVELELPS